MPSWNEAETTPDLLDVLRDAIRDNALEVSVSDDEPSRRPADRIERRHKRTPRQVLDGYLSSGMRLGLAVEMTRRYLAGGGDATVYRVRKLADQEAYDTRTERAKFDGLYHGAPTMHQSVTIGATPRGDTSGRNTKPHQLAEEWRAMRR